jgi:hypothetical protein
MTTPRHGSKAPTKRRSDWAASGWAWDPLPDPALRARRRSRRIQRAQRLAQIRAEIALASLRHPSMCAVVTPEARPGGPPRTAV